MEKTTKENGIAGGGETPAVKRDHNTAFKLFVFLIVLFALTTVALSVVLAVTVLRVDDDDDTHTPQAVVEGGLHQTVGASQPTAAPQNDEFCLTEGCVLAAARVKSALDETAAPCDDFYQFACGSWLKQHVIPDDKSQFGVFTKLRDDVTIILKYVLEAPNHPADPEAVHKARDYYKACMDEDKVESRGLTYILKYMDTFGGWPVLGNREGGHYNDSAFNLEDLLIVVRQGTNSPPFVDFGVNQDLKNPTQHILGVDQPGLGMPSREYYLKGRNDTKLMAYQRMLTDIAVAFGADRSTAETDSEVFVDLEIELAKITVPKEERRNSMKLYNKMTVGDLGNNFTGFDWPKYVKSVMRDGNVNVDEDEPVIVWAPSYFDKLFDLLHKYPTRTFQNYIVTTMVVGKTFYLPAKFSDIKLAYTKVLTGKGTRAPRWRDCAGAARDHFPDVVGRLFVQDAFHKDAKADVLDLIGKLKESFAGMIEQLSWMDKVTKAVAKEKLEYINPRIGYSDDVYDEAKLNERYQNLTLLDDDPLRNLMAVGRDDVQKNIKLLRQPYDKAGWGGTSAAEVNAYYSPPTNQITFPAAILQPPFYDKNQPEYLNYGGIGFVIGHELTHGFDDGGRLYDKNGKLRNWWLEEDARKFKVKAQCIIDQYSNFTVPGTGGMTLNGVNTQGENIADNGGVKESFWAYQKWVAARGREEARLPGLSYTSNQMYFINAAQVWCETYRDEAKVSRIYTDPHSLAMYRVHGPLQNFDEFSKAFNCPVGSFMNKASRCTVW